MTRALEGFGVLEESDMDLSSPQKDPRHGWHSVRFLSIRSLRQLWHKEEIE